MPTNKMKQKLAAGEPVFGLSVMIPSPQIVEMAGRLGFDWVLIDFEHGAISPETLQAMVMAAETSGITPVARPATHREEEITRLLDAGVLGLQVPRVNTAEEAAAIVAAVKFHPLGQRGLAVGTRAAQYGIGLSQAQFVAQANDATLVCVQLEEPQALDNLEAICAVKGVDVVFVGPSDLSQSLGFPGQHDAAPVQEAMRQAFSRIVAAGRKAGTTAEAARFKEYRSLGVSYFYTHITRILRMGSAEFFKAARDKT
jgi:4-hydroxy-2-oxoheptanedioate aldolase